MNMGAPNVGLEFQTVPVGSDDAVERHPKMPAPNPLKD